MNKKSKENLAEEKTKKEQSPDPKELKEANEKESRDKTSKLTKTDSNNIKPVKEGKNPKDALKKTINDKTQLTANPIRSDSKKKKADEFRKYMDDSGLPSAFNLIFSELISKHIKPENFFSYTAMRLRQFSKEIEEIKAESISDNN